MELDMIKRGLRAEIKKRKKETYATCQTNVRDMCTDVLSKLEEQEKEIAELKEENRKLKRALWLARAERAVAEQTVDEWSRYKEKHPFGSWREDPFEYWVQAWIYVEKLFRKKAKEYK